VRTTALRSASEPSHRCVDERGCRPVAMQGGDSLKASFFELEISKPTANIRPPLGVARGCRDCLNHWFSVLDAQRFLRLL
jgi:hypothetical protein